MGCYDQLLAYSVVLNNSINAQNGGSGSGSGSSGGGVQEETVMTMMTKLPGLETLSATRNVVRSTAGGQGLEVAQAQGLGPGEVATDVEVRAAIDELTALLHTVAQALVPVTDSVSTGGPGLGQGQGEEVSGSGRPAKRAKRDNKDNKASAIATATTDNQGGSGGSSSSGGSGSSGNCNGGERDALVAAFRTSIGSAEALWHRSRALFEWQGEWRLFLDDDDDSLT